MANILCIHMLLCISQYTVHVDISDVDVYIEQLVHNTCMYTSLKMRRLGLDSSLSFQISIIL